MSALTTVEVTGGDPLVVEVILPAEEMVQVVEVVTGAAGPQGPPGPPGLPGGVLGSGPATFLAVWDDEATTLTSAHDGSSGGSGSNLIGENLYGTLLGNPLLLVGARGLQHAIVGEIENDLAAHTIGYPTGVTGLGRVADGSDGNQAYALYGQAELYAAQGVVYGAQGNAANHSGSGPDLGFPPPGAVVAVGMASSVVTAGGDCSYGLWVNNDTSDYADPAFYVGAYIQTFRKYGLRIEAQSSGAQWGSYIAGNGSGYIAEFHSTAEPAPSNVAVFGTDHTGSLTWGFTFGGSLILEKDLGLSGTITLGTLPVNAANDAAAAGVGVPVGGIYRDGSVLMVRVV